MTPIEHFLIDINQILLRDCIENTIADIGRCEAATDIVQPTLHNLFHKRWPVIFFYGKGSFVLGVAYNIFNVGRQGFFVLTQPKLCFGRHQRVFIFVARKTLANHQKKTSFTDTYRKKCKPTSVRKVYRSRSKNRSPGDADQHFLIDINQILLRAWKIQ